MTAAPDYTVTADLLEAGVIMLVNQSVLWPRGYALRVHKDENGNVDALDIIDFGEYMAGFVDNKEDDDFLVKRVRALRQHELDREALFVGRGGGEDE